MSAHFGIKKQFHLHTVSRIVSKIHCLLSEYILGHFCYFLHIYIRGEQQNLTQKNNFFLLSVFQYVTFGKKTKNLVTESCQ